MRSTNSTAGNTPTEPKANIVQNVCSSSVDRIDTFINALAESRLSVRLDLFLGEFSGCGFNVVVLSF